MLAPIAVHGSSKNNISSQVGIGNLILVEAKHIEWHLTPRGWKSGSPAPPDRVLTMECDETNVTIDCREIWSCGSQEKIKPLIQRFGHAPKSSE